MRGVLFRGGAVRGGPWTCALRGAFDAGDSGKGGEGVAAGPETRGPRAGRGPGADRFEGDGQGSGAPICYGEGLRRRASRVVGARVRLVFDADPMNKFFVIEGPFRGKTFEISELASIGRGETCAVRLDGRHVSRVHARLEKRPDGMLIKDNGSRNGIFVNGASVREAILRADDQVEIGEHV